MTKVILIHSEGLHATDHVASLVGVEVGDLDDSLDEVLAVEAEDVLGDGHELDLALGAGVSAHWQEQETKRLLSEIIPQNEQSASL